MTEREKAIRQRLAELRGSIDHTATMLLPWLDTPHQLEFRTKRILARAEEMRDLIEELAEIQQPEAA